MVHRWVPRAALVVTALLVLACGGSVSATLAVLGPWQAVPFASLDASLAQAAEAACREKTPQSAGLPVVLHDQRGHGLDTVVFAGAMNEATCQVSGAPDGSVTWLTSGSANEAPGQPPAPLDLQVDSMGSSSGSDVQTISDIAGRTGAGVVRVRILLSDGSEVVATTSGSWFYAWWPGDASAASLSADDATGRMVATITP
jgi:hypothetical protein